MATEYRLSYTATEIDEKLGKVDNLVTKNEVPTKTSDLTNDSGFITSYTETDPTVPDWAKQSIKPTYTANEVGADSSGTASSLVTAHNTATDSHNDIRETLNNKLDSSELSSAIATALTQAKESGEFDGVSVTHEWNGTVLNITSASGTSSANLKGEKGDPGYTPVKGIDYWTDEDTQEIKTYIDEVIAGIEESLAEI